MVLQLLDYYQLDFMDIPINMLVIQVYASAIDTDDDKTNEFEGQIQSEIDRTQKQDMLLPFGDCNAKVGNHAGTRDGIRGKTAKFRSMQFNP